MLIKNTLIPISRLCGELKMGISNAMYQSSLYFFNVSSDTVRFSIDQVRPSNIKLNINKPIFEIGLTQITLSCYFIFPASKEKISVRNRNIFINAVLLGIKNIKQIAQKKAAL